MYCCERDETERLDEGEAAMGDGSDRRCEDGLRTEAALIPLVLRDADTLIAAGYTSGDVDVGRSR